MSERSESHDDCEEALQQLYVFLDGELTDTRRRLIAEHLGACSPCLGAFDFEAEVRMVIAQRCREQVPPALRQRIADALGAIGAEPPTPAS
jgi:mycothiol system anti-sigma-R factor